ncbi:MAG: Do family serine endopeptidase, partial [Verrucomicrobia bacterium]|nr:Do family serine endopeptidase [Verrucomicrobiota bacterium]NDB75021.1 Do family serine endopeptidase [Verrucomicrobiota bacterium]NDD40462.1 Do family serine endopeptidase [Verrucomicrobiota bacterium]NDF00700.1 Do family serine endopeptidase [Verrucomicrobiota bacterium]
MKSSTPKSLGLVFLFTLALGALFVDVRSGPQLFAASAPKLKSDPAPLSHEARPGLTFSPVIKKVSPSVVNIYTTKTVKENFRRSPFSEDPFFRDFFGMPFGERQIPREHRERALGSGVIVSEDGYILTNNHVVEGADEIKVALADDKTTYSAKVIGTDPQTDVAVIKVEGKNLPAITVTDSDLVSVGDVVLAIGNPFGLGQTVTMGIVSAKGRAQGIVDYEDFIQTDAAINPGNSGGALVDASGRLIGINTAILSRSGGNQGIGFAVPINLVRYVMDRLVTDGKVTRGYLGVMIQPVTPELAREFKLADNSGALVGEVTSDSPADKAGLKEGDVVTEFNGKKVTDSRQLRLMVSQTAPGTKAPLRLIRDGKVESDQQYRGFRWWNKGGGSRTSNNHFTRDVLRADGTKAYVGYGVDSLTVGLVAVCRVKFAGETRDAVASLYPTAEEARITCAIVDAAAK